MIKHPTLSPLNSHSKALYNPINPDGCVFALTKPYIGSDKWIDYSGYGNDGTIHGATKNSDGFLTFDGIDDYIGCGNNPSLNITDAVTFDMVIRSDISRIQTVLSKGDYKSAFLIQQESSELKFFGSHDGSIWDYNGIVLGTIEIGKLCHVIVTLDQINGLKSYINGVEGGSFATTVTLKPTIDDPLKIGKRWDWNPYFWQGEIIRASIYSRCMPTFEALQTSCYPY